MIGIKEIASYIPKRQENNFEKLARHAITESFITDKIGFEKTTKKESSETSSDLCIKAFEALSTKVDINKNEIDFISVCTQNPDFLIPQTSAVVHEKLGLPRNVASFDISLGCSGFVYGIHTIKAFMEQNDFKRGLFFTSDPYSVIVDPEDKNTDLLFGDAAAVTLLDDSPILNIGKGVFGTCGKKHHTLIKEKDNPLYMNGREIFNFVIKNAPSMVRECIEKNNKNIDEIDIFAFHQASKFILDNLCKRLKLSDDKVPFNAASMGNTVSSTIPILLEDYLHDQKIEKIVASGFGVGLSIGTTYLYR
jgi:3-oxoacyl-[acyl-carrier-protein] synthase-3